MTPTNTSTPARTHAPTLFRRATGRSASWFMCDEPVQEPSFTCFLTPSYMRSEEGYGEWTCTTGDAFLPTGEE